MGFNESSWGAPAYEIGPNGVEPWGLQAGISTKAYWISSIQVRGHIYIYCTVQQPNNNPQMLYIYVQYMFATMTGVPRINA